ncbi:1-phosphofructokinase family hexose kinase [Mariniplasma anaerobium]|uniref:Tagatose-6-phosphate kinase n=1 Tax=Mariniplasma anaerobium TaxID=2735436 RepID=A0A7U9XVQ3_9MOLU|nr:1-phosphofructokinase family hexose kinase [Mariniplasma anaerobium]BCR36802.1 tagatose-6-phosphate kinase [Mariniplasma anaerobium]
MFITITLNPAIDTMIFVDKLDNQKHANVIKKQKVAGGKGINISKVLKQLNEKTFATGFLGGTNGKFISKELSKLHIDHQFINIEGNTRENIKIFDQFSNESFDINDQGPSCDMNHFNELIILLKSLIKPKDVVIISGSAPIDFDADIYKILIKEIKHLADKIILDTSKAWFKEGLTATPDLIKPNLEELKEYANQQLDDEPTIIKEALKICDTGVSEVLVSLGKIGSLYVSKKHIYKISVPDIKVYHTVGAGDALLAGFVSNVKKHDLEFALKRATAISLAYIAHRDDIEVLHNLITIQDMKA